MTILDPCVGPGTFIHALRATGKLTSEDHLVGVDVDPRMVRATRAVHSIEVHLADYLSWLDSRKFDAAIVNPPYVRQEWLDDKPLLMARLREEAGVRIPGSANLYVYFLVRMVTMLAPGGRFTAVVYDSWKHTRYGIWLQDFLDSTCQSVTYQQIAKTPFRGRLIDASIMSGVRRKRAKPSGVHHPPPSSGGLLSIPGMLSIDALYETRRGLRLKQAGFFLCSPDDRGRRWATPFVKRIRYVEGFAVDLNHPEAALLVSTGERSHPAMRVLRARLQEAASQPDENVAILTWARERPDRWYSHAPPPRAPILVNYFLRGRPRHILNPELAYSDNFYGLTPRVNHSPYALLALLNSTATTVGILSRSRNQGAGLRKVQLFEYRSAATPDPARFSPKALARLTTLGRELIGGATPQPLVYEIDEIIASAFGNRDLSTASLRDKVATYFAS